MTQTTPPKNHYRDWSIAVVKGGGSDTLYLEVSVMVGEDRFTGVVGMLTNAYLYAEDDSSRWLLLNKEDMERMKQEFQRLVRRLNGREEMDKPTNPPLAFTPQRTPLWSHKDKLIAFLKKKGSATRGEILSGTHIPLGTLSLLLREKEFEQVRRGLWGLRKKNRLNGEKP